MRVFLRSGLWVGRAEFEKVPIEGCLTAMLMFFSCMFVRCGELLCRLKRRQTFINRCLRNIVGIWWPKTLKNPIIRSLNGLSGDGGQSRETWRRSLEKERPKHPRSGVQHLAGDRDGWRGSSWRTYVPPKGSKGIK